jgi:Flp pilus assembly protein TadG
MKYRSQTGQAIVEFCIVLPLLLILLIGTIEFSLVLYNQAVITNASREGARAGILAQTPPKTAGEIWNIVHNYCATRLITFQATAPSVSSVSTNWTNPSVNDTLTVTVNYNYGFLVLPNFITSGTQLPLRARTIMRYD